MREQVAGKLDEVFGELDHWDCSGECGHKGCLLEWRDDLARRIISLIKSELDKLTVMGCDKLAITHPWVKTEHSEICMNCMGITAQAQFEQLRKQLLDLLGE